MAERRGTRVLAAVGVVLTKDQEAELCTTRNLSPHGMLVRSDRTLEPGHVVDVDLIHQKLHLVCKGRVVSCTDNGYGIGFFEVPPELQKELDRLIDELAGRPGVTLPFAVLESQHELRAQWTAAAELTADLSPSLLHDCALTSLSLDGAAFVAQDRPALNARVWLRLHDVDAPATAALVVRHTEHGVAVRFSEPSDALRHDISLLLNRVRAESRR